MSQGIAVDLSNRDPNGKVPYLQFAADEIICEPESLHSADCVWINANKCFELWKNLCYKIMTFLCAICIAMYWGCNFACTGFTHIWIYNPCIHDFGLCCGCLKRVFSTILDCCLVPLCGACGHMFNNIRVAKC